MKKISKKAVAACIGASTVAALGVGVVMTSNHMVNLAIRRDGKLSDITGKQNVMGNNWDQYHEKIEAGENWYYTCSFDELEIYSQDLLKLKGKYFEHEDEIAKGTVIMCHGYRGNGRKDLSYTAKRLFESGFNVLLIDQRATNKSQGKYLCFGEKEATDMACWVNYLRKMKPKEKIYMYGVSMGATTVLMALEQWDIKNNVSAVVADCGFSSIGMLAKRFLKESFHLPEKPFFSLANRLYGLKTGCDLNKSTVDILKKNHIPVMFIHGSKDKFVSEEMSKENFQACAAENKKLVIVPGASHGQSVFVDSAGVMGKMIRFLEKA